MLGVEPRFRHGGLRHGEGLGAAALSGTHVNRAMVAFLSGDLQKAMDNARAAREAAPGMLHGWYVEGKALMARGELESARRAL